MRVLQMTDTHLISDKNCVQEKIHYESFNNIIKHFNKKPSYFKH